MIKDKKITRDEESPRYIHLIILNHIKSRTKEDV